MLGGLFDLEAALTATAFHQAGTEKIKPRIVTNLFVVVSISPLQTRDLDPFSTILGGVPGYQCVFATDDSRP